MAKVRLQSGDKREFLVEVEVANHSILLNKMLSNSEVEKRKDGDEELIPLHQLDGKMLEKVTEWMEHHKGDETLNWKELVKGKVEISEWNAIFLDGFDEKTIFEVISAAYYLDIKPLIDVACQKVANMMKGMNEQEMRELFSIDEEQKVVVLSPEDVPHVQLRSSDGVKFQVETEVAALIPKVNQVMLVNGVEEGEGEIIPVSETFSGILEKVIEWVKLHKDDPPSPPEDNEGCPCNSEDEKNISDVDTIFLNEHLADGGDLLETLVVAEHLGVEGLGTLVKKQLRNLVVDKSIEEIKAALNLSNDLSQDDLHFIQIMSKWANQN